MDVIDVGVRLLRMHSSFEVSSKVDNWHAHRGFTVFLEN
jgi:aspartyl aminopeptidase